MSLSACGKEIICRHKAIALAESIIEHFIEFDQLNDASDEFIDYSIKQSSAVIPHLENAIKTIAK
jgi:hypothetical protein